ncbi:MAG TPA: hypothetical protein VHB30_13725, partial [Solirubrobacteraceae bacterium]|nr:hypothetical protein [Solirubrobacteraceae bacterium]
EAAHGPLAEATEIARRTGDASLLTRAALLRCGIGVEIVEVDPERVALLEEAREALGEDGADAAISAVEARLAVELYYARPRERSERLSLAAVERARAAGDPRAPAVALNARHVALWRPDRLRERLAVAEEMIAAARAARDPALHLQGRNWRVADLFEAGEVDRWREEVARYGELARSLRMPVFGWYSTVWAAVDALYMGDLDAGRALRDRAVAEGRAAGDRNARVFEQMLVFAECEVLDDFSPMAPETIDYAMQRLASDAVSLAYVSGFAWYLAWAGEPRAAREQLARLGPRFERLPFDANWMTGVGESMEAARLIGDGDVAAAVLDVLAPYAGRPLTAGRACNTMGAVDRQLGNAAAVLGRWDEAAAHYEAAVRIDSAAGWVPFADRARAALAAL